MGSSREAYLEQALRLLKFKIAYKALLLVRKEMRAPKYTRHNGTHYYYHCVDVATMLINEGIDDEDTITAALLHDIVEDVPGYTYETIKNGFNETVADIVLKLTKNPSINYKIHPEQFEVDLEIMSQDARVALIKTADRIHNISTLLDASLDKQLRKALETENYFIPFFKKCRNLYPWHAPFFLSAKTQIEHTIERIKQNHKHVAELQTEIDRLKAKLGEVKGNEYSKANH